ncbi:hypothetical protein ACKVMT_06280 [Halobacteriales archaeon Cl-PHB]
MDLDQLQSVRDRERQTDKLQQLRDSFYEDATAFVRDLREERDRAAAEADHPLDAPEVNRLSDQIRTAEQTIEAIYEKRVGKLVKAATFAAADLPAEADGMTAEEEDLFETLVDEIQANRRRVLGQLTGDVGSSTPGPDLTPTGGDEPEAPAEAADAGHEAPEPTAVPPDDGPQAPDRVPPEAEEAADGESGMSAADVMQGGDEAPEPPGGDASDTPSDGPDEAAGADEDADTDGEDAVREDGSGGVERELVRITDDVGAIFGVDEREYELAKDDVVSLPTENAEPLLERDAAERL